MILKTGFTLAELLIALAILGVIATFTIPKVLQGQSDSKKYAVMKETIAALNAALNTPCQMGEITESNIGTYLVDHLNAIKLCRTDGVAEGCWTQSDPMGTQATKMAVTLASGAVIGGLDDTNNGTGMDNIIVDWNGINLPNTEGEDQIVLKAVITSAGGGRVCTIRNEPGYPTSDAFLYSIFNH